MNGDARYPEYQGGGNKRLRMDDSEYLAARREREIAAQRQKQQAQQFARMRLEEAKRRHESALRDPTSVNFPVDQPSASTNIPSFSSSSALPAPGLWDRGNAAAATQTPVAPAASRQKRASCDCVLQGGGSKFRVCDAAHDCPCALAGKKCWAACRGGREHKCPNAREKPGKDKKIIEREAGDMRRRITLELGEAPEARWARMAEDAARKKSDVRIKIEDDSD